MVVSFFVCGVGLLFFFLWLLEVVGLLFWVLCLGFWVCGGGIGFAGCSRWGGGGLWAFWWFGFVLVVWFVSWGLVLLVVWWCGVLGFVIILGFCVVCVFYVVVLWVVGCGESLGGCECGVSGCVVWVGVLCDFWVGGGLLCVLVFVVFFCGVVCSVVFRFFVGWMLFVWSVVVMLDGL